MLNKKTVKIITMINKRQSSLKGWVPGIYFHILPKAVEWKLVASEHISQSERKIREKAISGACSRC